LGQRTGNGKRETGNRKLEMGKDLVSAGIQLGIGQPNSLATGDLAMAIGIADVRIEGRPLSTLQLSQQQVKGYLF